MHLHTHTVVVKSTCIFLKSDRTCYRLKLCRLENIQSLNTWEGVDVGEENKATTKRERGGREEEGGGDREKEPTEECNSPG